MFDDFRNKHLKKVVKSGKLAPVHIPIAAPGTSPNHLEARAEKQARSSIFARGSGLLQDQICVSNGKSHREINNNSRDNLENMFVKKMPVLPSKDNRPIKKSALSGIRLQDGVTNS